MSDKYSKASKKRWANIPPEKRSEIMSLRAKQRLAKMTPKEIKEMANKMVRARRCKKAT